MKTANLPNIVAGLMDQAAFVARYEALETERAEAAQWAKAVSEFADGEEVNSDALTVLIELRARGFEVSKDNDGTVLVAKEGRGTSFVHSNANVIRLGQIFLRLPR